MCLADQVSLLFNFLCKQREEPVIGSRIFCVLFTMNLNAFVVFILIKLFQMCICMTSLSSYSFICKEHLVLSQVKLLSRFYVLKNYKNKQIQFETKDLHYIMGSSHQCGSLDTIH